MLLRNHSTRAPLFLVIALAITTSLFGLWYSYSMHGPSAPSSWNTDVTPVGSHTQPTEDSAEKGADEDSSPAAPPPPPASPPAASTPAGPDDDDDDDEYPITSKIAKVTVAANKLDNDLIRRALMTHHLQNKKFGYRHFIANNQAVSDIIENDHGHRPKGAWTKPAYILSLIVAELEKPEEDRLEWLFWFDADTVVMNPYTPLDVFLPPADDPELEPMNFFMAQNWDGLNSGAFGIRVCPWSASLMSAVLAYPIYEDERMQKDRFRDQSAFQFLLEHDDSPLRRSFSKGREHYAVPPMRWFNALPVNNAFDKNKPGLGWLFGHKMEGALFDNGTTEVFDDGTEGKIQPWKIMRGDMIVHFAGTTAGGTRDSWMGRWLERAEALLPEWADEGAAERIRGEADEFWKTTSKRVKEERIVAEEKQAKWDAEQKIKQEEEKKKKEAEEAAKKKEEEKKKAEEAKKEGGS